MKRTAGHRHRHVIAVVAAGLATLALASPALAQWQPAARVDNQAEPAASTTSFDLAVGSNGLASLLFAQKNEGDAATAPGTPYFARRSATDPAWPASALLALPNGFSGGSSITLGAAGDGSARGTLVSSAQTRGFSWDAGGSPEVGTNPAIASAGSAGLAVLPDGRAFYSGTSSGKIVYAEFTPGSGWGPATELAAAGNRPVIAVSPAGDLAIAYSVPAASDTQMVIRRRLAGESSFSAPANGTVAAPSDNAVMVFGADRAITLAYIKPSANPVDLARVQAVRWALGGANVSPTVYEVSGPTTPQTGGVETGIRIGIDSSSRVTVAWMLLTASGSRSLQSAERIADTFSAPQVISAASSGQFDLIVDSAGTATAAYIEGAAAAARVTASRRATGGSWRDEIVIPTPTTGFVPRNLRPRLATTVGQTEVGFLLVHTVGSTTRDELWASRFAGPPPVGGPDVGAAEGCPVGYNKISGGDGDDTLNGTGGSDAIFGRGGNDHIGGGLANDCIRGGAGDDTAGGEAGDDELSGEDGNDGLRGDQGDDILLGNAGTDSLFGGDGNDFLVGDTGSDRLSGGQGRDRLEGGTDPDRLLGGAGDDSISGGDGDDVISGGSGNDVAFGDAGDDRMSGGSGRNELRGGDGDDRLRGGSGRDLLVGDAGIDRLFGLGGADLLIAGDGADLVSGGAGNDRIFGRAGNDRLRGGAGKDKIVGGAGDDRIWGDDGRDTISGGSGDDLIHAADGSADVIACGRGKDRVIADRRDRVARNCERVRYRAPAP